MARFLEINLTQKKEGGFPVVVSQWKDATTYFVLTMEGVETFSKFNKEQDKRNPIDKIQVDKCIRFLRGVPILLPKNKTYFSYSLKHIIESSIGNYISNGALIFAALTIENYKITTVGGSLNAYISLRRGGLIPDKIFHSGEDPTIIKAMALL